MNFLLDTNVVSEWVKPRPDPGVIEWLAEVDEDRVFISVITLAELRYGVDRLKDAVRRKRLDTWLSDELMQRFSGRILPIDVAIAEAWGRLVARRSGLGRPLHPMDGFIAAIAHVHGLSLVTRNEADFRQSVKTIINPWNRNE